ncbi:hypothetical protein [Microbacterium sp. SCN 69-37]|uniref:hypothetical protein n=1 Tax=Microbacterium sp. SCN 69-37 TaxID=1660115 RepID=UPI000B32F39C|nr:hypothetical protein [Microbacterium sp. SCN 69-37]
MPEITITPARRGDLPAAADVLAEAFEADPVLAAIVPTPGRWRTRLAHLFHGMLAAGAFTTGTVDLARDGDGSILGVAVWEGPNARTALSDVSSGRRRTSCAPWDGAASPARSRCSRTWSANVPTPRTGTWPRWA